MYLGNNLITRLPAELFRLSSLTVLSLRESLWCSEIHVRHHKTDTT